MNAYTVSRLAFDAGVSVHIVRDYLLRGLLRPVACTTGGYGLFDDAALQRLCFVRAAFEAGIGLGALARQFHRSSPHPAPGTACGEFAMNSPERMPAETHKPFTGYLWGTLAVLTCPCHLSILAAVLAGTTAGAFLVEYWVITALGLTGLFLLSLARALRAFRERS